MKHGVFLAGIVAAATALTAVAALAQGPGRGPTFETLDTDGDGQITRGEMASRAVARFADADTDGDGQLTRTEMEQAAAKRMSARVTAMIERFDTDANGALSMAELPKPRRADARFERIDRDQDGVITRVEFDEAKAHMRDHKARDGHKGKDRSDASDKN